MTRAAPSFNAASSTAPPPTQGSMTTSPGRTRAALSARKACSGGMALGASTALSAARESMPHAMTSHIEPSGWRYTCGSIAGFDSSANCFSSDVALAMSHARFAATSLPTPASHSSAPTRSRATLGTPLRPGASTCAAHFAARSGPMAVATIVGSPVATGASAMRVSAHRRTAARAAVKDGNATPAVTTVSVPPPDVEGTASPIHRGVGASPMPPRISVTAASAEPSSRSAMLPSSAPTRPPSRTRVTSTGPSSADGGIPVFLLRPARAATL